MDINSSVHQKEIVVNKLIYNKKSFKETRILVPTRPALLFRAITTIELMQRSSSYDGIRHHLDTYLLRIVNSLF